MLREMVHVLLSSAKVSTRKKSLFLTTKPKEVVGSRASWERCKSYIVTRRDKWWIKCSSFSLTGTWHNYTEPIYINFLLTYWIIISHVFFVWLWWRSNKMKPALNHIFKSELKNLKCHVRKWTCLRLKISNIFGATALSEKRIHRQRRKELKNWEL